MIGTRELEQGETADDVGLSDVGGGCCVAVLGGGAAQAWLRRASRSDA